MLINEVCKKCALTKKAIEYYMEQGLISPQICKNGYRNFSKSDIDKLMKISILRKLDLGIDSIKRVLYSAEPNKILSKLADEKELELNRVKLKIELLERLGQGHPWEEIANSINLLFEKQTITEKLISAFPGYFGRFISMYFGQFLNEPIVTEEQKDAYNTIVQFLDNIKNISIPPELESYLDNDNHFTIESMKGISENMLQAVQDIDKFIEVNHEFLKQYIAYKKSDEYSNSLAYKLQSILRDFNSTIGYYDIFIPNMKKLSPKYNEYYTKLESSNEVLISKYPDMAKW